MQDFFHPPYHPRNIGFDGIHLPTWLIWEAIEQYRNGILAENIKHGHEVRFENLKRPYNSSRYVLFSNFAVISSNFRGWAWLLSPSKHNPTGVGHMQHRQDVYWNAFSRGPLGLWHRLGEALSKSGTKAVMDSGGIRPKSGQVAWKGNPNLNQVSGACTSTLGLQIILCSRVWLKLPSALSGSSDLWVWSERFSRDVSMSWESTDFQVTIHYGSGIASGRGAAGDFCRLSF